MFGAWHSEFQFTCHFLKAPDIRYRLEWLVESPPERYISDLYATARPMWNVTCQPAHCTSLILTTPLSFAYHGWQVRPRETLFYNS
jgi:hypothetical protein